MRENFETVNCYSASWSDKKNCVEFSKAILCFLLLLGKMKSQEHSSCHFICAPVPEFEGSALKISSKLPIVCKWERHNNSCGEEQDEGKKAEECNSTWHLILG